MPTHEGEIGEITIRITRDALTMTGRGELSNVAQLALRLYLAIEGNQSLLEDSSSVEEGPIYYAPIHSPKDFGSDDRIWGGFVLRGPILYARALNYRQGLTPKALRAARVFLDNEGGPLQTDAFAANPSTARGDIFALRKKLPAGQIENIPGSGWALKPAEPLD